MHLDIELALWWDFIEASSTSIALYIDDSQSVARISTDALETGKQTWFDFRFQISHLLFQLLFVFACLLHDFIEFAFLLFQSQMALFNQFFCSDHVVFLLLNANKCLIDFLVTEFYFQCLELYFLAQRIVFAVVLHLVEL